MPTRLNALKALVYISMCDIDPMDFLFVTSFPPVEEYARIEASLDSLLIHYR
jgi:hypothetical protein